MDETIEAQKISQIKRALEHYRNGSVEDDLTDLITDALHYAAVYGIEAEKLTSRALAHIAVELRWG